MIKFLNPQERIDFVSRVIEGCTVEGEFQYSLFDLVFRVEVMRTILNVDISNVDESEYGELAYADWYREHNNDISNKSFTSQCDSLRSACEVIVKNSHDDIITFAQMNNRTSVDDLVDTISEFVESAKESLSDVDAGEIVKLAKIVSDIDKDSVAAKVVSSAKRQRKKAKPKEVV